MHDSGYFGVNTRFKSSYVQPKIVTLGWRGEGLNPFKLLA